jgi:hypothetical protein
VVHRLPQGFGTLDEDTREKWKTLDGAISWRSLQNQWDKAEEANQEQI